MSPGHRAADGYHRLRVGQGPNTTTRVLSMARRTEHGGSQFFIVHNRENTAPRPQPRASASLRTRPRGKSPKAAFRVEIHEADSGHNRTRKTAPVGGFLRSRKMRPVLVFRGGRRCSGIR